LLQEPQQGVAGLVDWVETDVDGATERAIVQKSQDSVELAGCNNARGTVVLHQCRMTQRGVQWCEMNGVLQQLRGQRGSTCQQQVELQHQSMFLAQQRGQLRVFLFLELLEQPHLVEVLHVEHSKAT